MTNFVKIPHRDERTKLKRQKKSNWRPTSAPRSHFDNDSIYRPDLGHDSVPKNCLHSYGPAILIENEQSQVHFQDNTHEIELSLRTTASST